MLCIVGYILKRTTGQRHVKSVHSLRYEQCNPRSTGQKPIVKDARSSQILYQTLDLCQLCLIIETTIER